MTYTRPPGCAAGFRLYWQAERTMPSPFPGMDPYLEDPAIWPNVHSTLINVTRDLLLPALRPRYFVGIEERVYVSAEQDPGRQLLVPDVYVKPMSAGGSPPAAKAPGLRWPNRSR